MELKNIELEISNKIAKVVINRPEKLNALNAETVTELFQLLKKLKQNSDVAAIIITGKGEKAFVAGADITEITHHDDISGRIFAMRGQKVFRFIEKMEKPVVAAINGFALGGGCELAMSCHLKIASDKAKFAHSEIKLGLIPAYGGTQRLPKLIGRSRTLYLLLTGEMIDAKQALDIGLINEIVPSEKLISRATDLASQLVSNAPLATRYILQTTMEGEDLNLDSGLNLEAELFGNICNTEDANEGIKAFLEKRKPKFKGK